MFNSSFFESIRDTTFLSTNKGCTLSQMLSQQHFFKLWILYCCHKMHRSLYVNNMVWIYVYFEKYNRQCIESLQSGCLPCFNRGSFCDALSRWEMILHCASSPAIPKNMFMTEPIPGASPGVVYLCWALTDVFWGWVLIFYFPAVHLDGALPPGTSKFPQLRLLLLFGFHSKFFQLLVVSRGQVVGDTYVIEFGSFKVFEVICELFLVFTFLVSHQ